MSGTAFSGERLIRNRERGIISVVKFTADWCPNCRYVEARALNTESVRRAMSSSGRDFMTADITRESPEAMELMMKLGSRSIPLLAVFPAGDDFVRPLCLRDIYSEGDVLDALSKAEKSRPVPGGPVEYRFQVKQTGALSR
jgi:thiol:disulfide interchange protein DsbD